MKVKNSGERLILRRLNKTLSFALAISCSGVLQLPNALAKVDQFAPGGVDANSLDAASVDCNNFCEELMGFNVSEWDMDKVKGSTPKQSKHKGSGDKYKGSSLTSSASDEDFKMKWARADDQWCADHGSPTDEAVSARSPVIAPSPSSSPFASQQCPYPQYPGENCDIVKKKLTRCKLRNSQVESQCSAYMKAKQGLNWQWTMVVLDTAAAGTCLLACHGGDVSSLSGMAAKANGPCAAVAAIASGTELIGVFKMQQDSKLKTILSGGTAAIGLVGAGYTGKKALDSYTKAAGQGYQDHKDATEGACITGYAMTAMAAVRGYNIYSTTDTMDQACKQVQDLASQAASALGNQPDTMLPPNTNNASIIAGAGAGTGNSTGATNGATNGSTSALTSSPDMASGYSAAQTAQAADAGLLSKGLDKVALPKSQMIDPLKMMQALKEGGPAAAVQSGFSDMGVRLPAQGMQMAKAVLQESEQYARAGKFNGGHSQVAGSAYANNGSGSGNAGQAGSGTETVGFDAFGNNMGAKGGESTEVNLTPQSFGPDIWHTHAKQNIFQIVSEKIGQVGYRVR